jgi:hypothetical protein
MMFLVRTNGKSPDAAGVAVKLCRATPEHLPGSAGSIDFFCVGEAAALAVLRETGWVVVDLHDGYYEDGNGGGVVIWGQGRYWEIRDTPLTVKEAVGATEPAAEERSAEHPDVRGAIFGGTTP